jgi:hypothetical protein
MLTTARRGFLARTSDSFSSAMSLSPAAEAVSGQPGATARSSLRRRQQPRPAGSGWLLWPSCEMAWHTQRPLGNVRLLKYTSYLRRESPTAWAAPRPGAAGGAVGRGRPSGIGGRLEPSERPRHGRHHVGAWSGRHWIRTSDFHCVRVELDVFFQCFLGFLVANAPDSPPNCYQNCYQPLTAIRNMLPYLRVPFCRRY